MCIIYKATFTSRMREREREREEEERQCSLLTFRTELHAQLRWRERERERERGGRRGREKKHKFYSDPVDLYTTRQQLSKHKLASRKEKKKKKLCVALSIPSKSLFSDSHGTSVLLFMPVRMATVSQYRWRPMALQRFIRVSVTVGHTTSLASVVISLVPFLLFFLSLSSFPSSSHQALTSTVFSYDSLLFCFHFVLVFYTLNITSSFSLSPSLSVPVSLCPTLPLSEHGLFTWALMDTVWWSCEMHNFVPCACPLQVDSYTEWCAASSTHLYILDASCWMVDASCYCVCVCLLSHKRHVCQYNYKWLAMHWSLRFIADVPPVTLFPVSLYVCVLRSTIQWLSLSLSRHFGRWDTSWPCWWLWVRISLTPCYLVCIHVSCNCQWRRKGNFSHVPCGPFVSVTQLRRIWSET